MSSNVFEVVKQTDAREYFAALLDADTGVIIIRTWTTQPEGWLEWASQISEEYIRLRRKRPGLSPALAAKAARQSVMAAGPSNMRFVDRWELVKFPPLP